MLNKSVAKNYFYNLVFQFFKLLAPLLVTPYIARVLGENGTGKYSFSYSVVSYFLLFAALGFQNYAQRLVASHQGNKKKQSIDFWEIIFARLIPVFLTLIIYTSLVGFNVYGEKYNTLLKLFSIEIVAIAFDISFFLQGNEEFSKTVFCTIIIRTISYICIFIFVNNERDLEKYVIIQSLSVLFINMSLWIYIPKYLEKISLKELRILKHIPATFVLFLPTIATSIYTSLDKTLIGLITNNDAQNGNYEYAEKMVKMALTFVTALGTVLIPRNSKKFAEGDIDGIKNNIYISTKFVFFLGVPLMFGCMSISDTFVPWFLGPNYSTAASIMKVLSPIIIIIGLSNVFGLQFLIPSKQDKRFTQAIVTGSIVNLLLNLILIPSLGASGAAVATVVAESFVTGTMLYFIKKDIDLIKILRNSWKYWISGLAMFVACKSISCLFSDDFIVNVVIILTGLITYILALFILKDDFLNSIVCKIFLIKIGNKT